MQIVDAHVEEKYTLKPNFHLWNEEKVYIMTICDIGKDLEKLALSQIKNLSAGDASCWKTIWCYALRALKMFIISEEVIPLLRCITGFQSIFCKALGFCRGASRPLVMKAKDGFGFGGSPLWRLHSSVLCILEYVTEFIKKGSADT